MKKQVILLRWALVLLSFNLHYGLIYSQMVNVEYTLKVKNLKAYLHPCSDAAKEPFDGDYEWTAQFYSRQKPLTGVGFINPIKTGCFFCDSPGDCEFTGNYTIDSRTTDLGNVYISIDAWENDLNPAWEGNNRCDLREEDDDNVVIGGFYRINFRELGPPSSSTYHENTYNEYLRRGQLDAIDPKCNTSEKISNLLVYNYTTGINWKYTGTENPITPSCSQQTTNYISDIVPSWTMNLTAGVSYYFDVCDSGFDSYLRLYGSDGFTLVASNDNTCGTGSKIFYTPLVSGIYYLELTSAFRNNTPNGGTLKYGMNIPTNQTCANALSIATGSNKYFNTNCSTQDAPAQTCGQSANEHKDVWFKYTPSSTGSLKINSTSNFDSRISVYSGTCNSLTLINCNTTGTYVGGPNNLTLNVCKGTTYLISIGGTYGGTGAGLLSLSLTPANTPPSISCPANSNLFNSPGICGRIFNYSTPNGTDNCTGAVTAQIAGLPSGSTFPIGVTTNTFKVTDTDGATAVCSFTVSITDNEKPTITCPPSITVNKCSAVSYYFPAPTVSDNCGSENVTIQQVAGLPSGSTFPLGVTTNTFRALDGRPNVSNNCSFNITVTENAPLSITCPNNLVIDANPLDCYRTVVNYSIPQVDGSPECGLQLSLVGNVGMTGTEFSFGTTTVTWQVATTDGTNQTATCSFTVRVQDSKTPVITCPSDISVDALAGTCQRIVTYTSPTKSDNCFGPAYPILSQISGFPSGASFPVGTTTNIFRATDLSGNSSTCSFSIHVADATPPSITCPENIEKTLSSTECSEVVHFIEPVGTDNCSGAITIQTEGLPSGSNISVGSTTNTFVVTDAAGMSASCTFTISVSDPEPPRITCPENISVDGNPGIFPCETPVFYHSPLGTDNCNYVSTTRTTGLPSGAFFPEGETMVTFMATDAGGLNASCSFTVTVGSCNQAPSAQCKNLEVTADEFCQANISSENANDGSFDPDSDDLTFSISPQGPYELGNHIITFKAQDAAGLEDDCTFVLSVVDNSPPLTPILPTILLGECTGTPPVPTANDHCEGPITGTTSTVFPILNQGTTVVIWTFDDGNGNRINVPQNVIVEDITPPNIPVLPDLHLNPCESPQDPPTTTDNCTGLVVGQTSSIFPISEPGSYNIIWVFDDGHGNKIDVSQNVVIEIPNVPGQYLNLNTCALTPCPPGTYCPGGTIEPILCPAGKFQGQEGQSECIPCQAGSYSQTAGSTICLSCPAGKYQDLEGQTNCKSCTVGTYSDVTGSVFCQSCPAGKYQNLEGQTSCLNCPAGKFSDVTGAIECQSCPAGKFQDLEGQTRCLNCPAGKFSDITGATECQSCPAGKFSDVTGATVCQSCPAGKFQNLEGQTRCLSCPAGKFSNVTGATECQSCPAGKFQDLEGQTHCQSCPPGYYSDQNGSLSCTACPAQTYNPYSGATGCLDCPAGTYNPNTAAVICPDCNLSLNCSSMSTNTDAGYCRASAVDLTEPEIIHSCPIQSLYHNAPSIFPVGNTIITWTITDVSGMSATCQQTITVKKIADENLLYSYVILSNDEIKMKENMVESGGIGVMSSKKISLEQNTKIVGIHTFVKSQNIDIKSGSMATNQIKAKVPVSMMPPFAENNSPGNNDIKISDNKPPVSLKSGSYGKVEIGKNVIVTFSGQSKVFIKELKLEDGSQLKFDQSTQLMIDKKLDIENFVNINQQEMTGIQFYVEEAVKIGKSCNVRANIFTKKEIKISKATANKRTYMTGIFVADKVDAEDYVTWNWDPSYCPQEPDLELNSKTNGEIPFVNYFEKFPYTDKTQILIHPNPANQMIQVKINEKSESNYLLRILNSMGKEVYQQYHPSNIGNDQVITLDVSRYDAGIYYLNILINQKEYSKAFIIMK